MSDMKEEGNKDKAEGKLREGVGKITDDKSEQMKGKMQQAKGDLKKDLADDTDWAGAHTAGGPLFLPAFLFGIATA